MKHGEPKACQDYGCKNDEQPPARALTLWLGKRLRGPARSHRNVDRNPIEHRAHRDAENANHEGSAAEKLQQIMRWSLRGLDLLELEFVRPRDDRPPDELIQQNNHGDHRTQAPKNRPRVAVARRGFKE